MKGFDIDDIHLGNVIGNWQFSSYIRAADNPKGRRYDLENFAKYPYQVRDYIARQAVAHPGVLIVYLLRNAARLAIYGVIVTDENHRQLHSRCMAKSDEGRQLFNACRARLDADASLFDAEGRRNTAWYMRYSGLERNNDRWLYREGDTFTVNSKNEGLIAIGLTLEQARELLQ